MSAKTAASVLWVVWYVTWIAAVVLSGRTKVQMKTDVIGWDRALAGFGCVLLFWPTDLTPITPLADRLWRSPEWIGWVLAAGVVAAFGFCWWARLHLGRLWSGFVTLKDDHRIVDTGPYGLVRHPIYAGVMMAALATALIRPSVASLAGFALISFGFALVARTEERFLREQLGAADYDAYSARVAMLVPGVF